MRNTNQGLPMQADYPLQVLIVDDDRDAATGVAELVRLLGHEARVANNGFAGLDIVRNHPVDVALLDIEMPGMDGHEVARRLVRLRRQGVYIVAVTGRGSEDDMQRSVAAGFIEHVVKPCTMKGLSGVLARAADHLSKARRGMQSHRVEPSLPDPHGATVAIIPSAGAGERPAGRTRP